MFKTIFISYRNQKILAILFREKNKLLYPSNNFLKGILNEMNRVGRTYGTNKNDLQTLSLITMIDRLDEYAGLTAVDLADFGKRIQEEVMPHIEEFEKISQSQKIEDKVNDLLWNLISEWRLDFIKFLEVRRPTSQAPPQVQQDIKPQVKSKLVEELAKSLEDEVGGK